MDRDNQIEEMARTMCGEKEHTCEECDSSDMCEFWTEASRLYNAGYRKQSEGEWKDNHCTACGKSPIGDEAWTDIGLTPPKFEYCMSFCPCCGVKMKGGEG